MKVYAEIDPLSMGLIVFLSESMGWMGVKDLVKKRQICYILDHFDSCGL